MNEPVAAPSATRTQWHLLLLPAPGVMCGAFAFGGWKAFGSIGIGVAVAALCATFVAAALAFWDEASQARALTAWREAPARRRLPMLPYAQPGSPADALAQHGALLPALVINLLRSRNSLLIALALAGAALAAGLDATGFAIVIGMALLAQLAIALGLRASRTLPAVALHALLAIALPLALGASRAPVAHASAIAALGAVCALLCAVLLRHGKAPLAIGTPFMLYSLFALAT